MTSAADFDAAIIGAGAVGLACAYALTRRGANVVVLEREARIGAGVSSRNSEVIHAGLHYRPGSLKARLCVAGRCALYAFLQAHDVAFDRCGKLIVATEPDEIGAVQDLARRAEANGVEGVSWLTGEAARELEPGLRAVAALHSAESGVFDSHGYMFALQGEVEARGGVIALQTPFAGARKIEGGFAVRTGGAAANEFTSAKVVISAGLGAQSCAAAIAGFPTTAIPSLHYGKGSYFTLTGARAPFRRLIYPPPIPGALGIHYRRDLGGIAHFGPDLEFVAQEDYHVDPARAAGFYAYVRRFWPDLPDGALTPDYAGIRPKLHGAGEPQRDFVIADETEHGLANLVALFGFESPGLTSSLAVGEEVASRLWREG